MATVAVSRVSDKQTENEYEELFREHYPMVYRTAFSILNNAADAEDVLQGVFLRLMGRELPPEFRKNVKGYFYRAAVNRSLDTIRSRRRFQALADAEQLVANPASSESEYQEMVQRRVAEAIAELSPEAAHILILRYAHGYSDVEIAKLLGTSRGAIALRLFRSRARLRKLMRGCKGETK